MADEVGVDPGQVTAEEFAAVVAQSDDGQIAELVRSSGTEQVLDRIFDGMQERFKPDKAQGVDAGIQWIVTDGDDEYSYATTIRDGSCEITQGSVDKPKVVLKTDAVSFVKLITGRAQGPQLFMTGKLKVTGDLMFSQRITGFFETPKAN